MRKEQGLFLVRRHAAWEGVPQSLRLMRDAAKFHMPVITFIDTLGAYPGDGAEQRGQAFAIARNLFEMARLPVPIVAVLTGQGGSGGALARWPTACSCWRTRTTRLSPPKHAW